MDHLVIARTACQQVTAAKLAAGPISSNCVRCYVGYCAPTGRILELVASQGGPQQRCQDREGACWSLCSHPVPGAVTKAVPVQSRHGKCYAGPLPTLSAIWKDEPLTAGQ